MRTEEQIREYNREYQRRRRAELKALGLCAHCGRNPIEEGRRKLCAACRARENENARARREYLRGRGLCLDCGREKARPGHYWCEACQKRATERNYKKTHPEEIG